MTEQYQEIVRKHQMLLYDLLASQAIKYSDWPMGDVEELKLCSGIYHFYQGHDCQRTSIYVGKAAISENGWSLYKRLCQHFQPSQKNALLGKVAKQTGRGAEQIKEEYMNANIYLQWLPVTFDMADNELDDKRELVWLECFCKSILKPTYTDQ
ncbi:hypothetical protein GO003_007195 [Methylicorpusculum oleiharenae]|uniref:hypothetical protein n=1 Tax=Methylicorpusculum oleiharenae TaxID=1338687 RepID=UPI00135C2DC1|nr:hypothetical protein [Methylicorpusculum oleiharenae]MCD2450169.1 hypothetical protein [Methylicorpusculum oleiharenae]